MLKGKYLLIWLIRGTETALPPARQTLETAKGRSPKFEDVESSLLQQKFCSGDVIVQAEMSFAFQTPRISGI